MKKILLLTGLFALLAISSLSAQPLNRSTPEANLNAAKEAEAEGNYYAALEKYEEVYDETKDKEVYLKIGELNFKLRDYNRAERNFARLVLRDRKQEYTEVKYWYALCLKHNEKYADAIDMFRQYISDGADSLNLIRAKIELEGCQLARKASAPANLTVTNIGKKANSPQTEASPAYSNGQLYYASMQSKDVIELDGKEGDWYAKIYTAAKESETDYGEPTALGALINREGWHQGNVSISADGNTMFFTRVQNEGANISESKIYYSKRNADGWGAANEVVGVNGDYLAKHPAEGELYGEKVLFFVANIPGGFGGDDIYYATKKTDGVYSLPVKLDGRINTAGDEATPFYKDGKLYFSSNGRPSLGGLDVFESQWNGSEWSEPVNLGAGINTSLDDFFYTQSSEDGKSGFLVSNRPGPNNLKSKTCCDDIYSWELERIRVNLLATTFRYRTSKDKVKENPPLTNCTLSLVDISETDPLKTESKTNSAGNDFNFTLVPERAYMIVAQCEGYQADTLKLSTVGITKSLDINRKLTLRRLRREPDSIVVTINEPIRLNNIYYDFDDDKILPDAEEDLDFLLGLMNQYADMKIELSSHTDARGKDDYNEKLSQRRAESAKRWLVAKGVAEARIVAKGYGETQILNQCVNGVECTDEEHRFNRRTEFKILEGPTTITIERKEKKE